MPSLLVSHPFSENPLFPKPNEGGASSNQSFHFGDSLSSTQANFDGNHPYCGADKGPYLNRTCKVGSYRPNDYGLFDMHGNVWEWCSDWYSPDTYKENNRKDPQGPDNGQTRVLRGGSWYGSGLDCRSAYRSSLSPDGRSFSYGFRVVCVAQD